ncbi:MAG: hypothetical protein C0594_08375 [Marinilabiliales bacterium]|nr:MAG: hypothetical protein C0594_08375 [Marinilabiliales bacterium]
MTIRKWYSINIDKERQARYLEKFAIITISLGVGFIVLFLGMFLYQRQLNFFQPIDTSVWGQFGDLFGGVIGSLWAFAGVALFYLALHEQRKELKTTQGILENEVEALNNQKKEAELSNKLILEQQKTQRLQQFDNAYFSLLQILNTITDKITYEEEEERRSGKSAMKLYKKDFYTIFRNHDGNEIDKRTSYFRFNEKNGHNYNHQHELITEIVYFIDANDQYNEIFGKDYYISILTSTLSQDELILYYYYVKYEKKTIMNIIRELKVFHKLSPGLLAYQND